VHVHEVFEKREVHGLSRWLLQLEGPALRAARFLIFPERNRARLYEERYSLKNPIHVVYNCPRLSQPQSVRPRHLRQEYSIPTDHLIVGYMGGIGEANAILELVKALSLTPKVTLMLWGWANQSYLKEIQTAAQSLGLGNRVRIAGQVEDKWGHLAGCDVLYCVYRDHLLRTRFQATASNKFTEALGCGVPVLALKAGGFEQALAETRAGIAVSDLAASTLAHALDQLSDAALRGSLGAGARKAFGQEYNYDRQFAPVAEAFAHLVTPPNPLKTPIKNASIAR
jgi:glycosyltransferase involved in cell wall biosynthesis